MAMTQIVPLNKETYRDLKVDSRASAAFDSRRFVQVIVKEFPHLLVHYPILFSKDPQTGQFFCGAMLGFDEHENLFLEDWQQRDFYRPLYLQRGPFYGKGPELAIDLDDPRVGAENGKPLFTDQGTPTRYLQSIIWAFQDLTAGTEMTKLFIDRMLELKLIEPVDVELFRRGYLRLIDYMIASLKQVPVMARKKNLRLLKGTEGLASAVG